MGSSFLFITRKSERRVIMTELYLSKEEFEKLIVGESIKILVLNDEKPQYVVANLNISPSVRNDVLEAIKNTNALLEQISTSLQIDNDVKKMKGE